MALTYAELTAYVQETVEDVFTASQLETWTRQVEQKIYNTVQFPALRKNQTSVLNSGNRFVTLPTDYLYTHSFAVVAATGRYHYLLQKEVSFIREAYPFAEEPVSGWPIDPDTLNPIIPVGFQGIPKHYAEFDENTFLIGPVPDADFQVQLHYGYYPESIVTAGTTWLGDNFDSALSNGVLLEAARFIKEEPDVVGLYQKMYLESITLLKTLGDGKLKQDSYREGLPKVPVT